MVGGDIVFAANINSRKDTRSSSKFPNSGFTVFSVIPTISVAVVESGVPKQITLSSEVEDPLDVENLNGDMNNVGWLSVCDPTDIS